MFCNCDDPFESNFTKFFIYNFNYLKLKRLICTCYKGSVLANSQGKLFGDNISPEQKGYVLDIHKVRIKDGLSFDVILKYIKDNGLIKNLEGDGDFRSPEVIEYLKQADIVITNPPFSLFREYIAQLIEHNKKFITWGNFNAISNRDTFQLIKNNKIWLGFTRDKGLYFKVPSIYNKIDEKYTLKKNDGNNYSNMIINIYTNMDLLKKYEKSILYKSYEDNKDDYLKYDNYDAINVDKVKDIPKDYEGYMGVPINFFDKYNPYQFKIIGSLGGNTQKNQPELLKRLNYNFNIQSFGGCPIIKGKFKYTRIAILNRFIMKTNKIIINNDGFLHNSKNLYNFLEKLKEYKEFDISYNFTGNSFYLLDGNPFIKIDVNKPLINANELNYNALSKSNFDFSGGTFIINFMNKYINVYLEPQLRENIKFESNDKEVLDKFRKIIEENEKLVFGEL